MSYTEIAAARATAETYAGKMSRIAAELLDVLRDSLGPGRRLPEPRADYARYGAHSVTVRDGEDGRVEVTAYLDSDGAIREYSARLTYGDQEPRPWTAVGPLRMNCSEGPEEHPTLTYVLPLVIRLGAVEELIERARVALRFAGHVAEYHGPRLAVLKPGTGREWLVTATVEPDPDNGMLRAHGPDAEEVLEVLYRAKVF